MNRFRYFTAWLIESTLQDVFSEATLRFSQKYRDRDANEVPSGFWQWVHEKMGEDPRFTPRIEDDDGSIMSRDKVLNLVSQRMKNRTYTQSGGGGVPQERPRPVPVERPTSREEPPPAEPKPGGEWILAKVLDIPGLKPGDYIVVTRSNGKDWTAGATAMTRDAQTKNIVAPKIKTAIESVKKDDKPMTSMSAEDLWKYVDTISPRPQPKKPEPPKGPAVCDNSERNPHILSEKNLKAGDGEGWAIDQRFKAMLDNPKQSHMMINALAGSGKAQPLNSLLLTPKGWVKMGDIKIGDKVFGSDGMPHKVKGVFPQGVKEVYEVTFSDGTKVRCCGDHLWTTESKINRDKCRSKGLPLFSFSSTVNTKQIMDSLLHTNGSLNHYVPLVSPLEFNKIDTVIDPYVMGVLLGDGSFRTGAVSYTAADREIVESVDSTLSPPLTSNHVSRYDYRISGHIKGRRNEIVKEIKRLNLWDKKSEDKFIPDEYKFNDLESRVSVLQGLLDTDGTVQGSRIEYNTVSSKLCNDIAYLVQSVGGTASVFSRTTRYKHNGEVRNGKMCYRLNITLPTEIEPFRLSRKRAEYTPRTKYLPRRAVRSVEMVSAEVCQCISVDSPDNLYVTDNCVLTHNTTMLKHLAWKYGRKGQKWLYLVFNTKNRAEAEEYDKGCRKFPEFVQVATTNSFLGEALKNPKNKGRVPQTKRIADLAKLGLKGKIEKARFIADGEVFQKKMKEEYGIPFRNEVNEDLLREFGIRRNSMKYYLGAIGGVIGQIRKQFQERVLTLLDRLKSFGVNPRRKDALEAEVRKVFDKYDAHEDPETKKVTRGYFDTALEEVKERIDDYEPDFQAVVLKVLNDLMGYDFTQKNYRDEVISAATWLLQETLPLTSQQKVTTGYGRGQIEHKLGDYRDFNDDLWFSSIHADEMHWDKYDVVLADEVQDFNENQKIMLKKLHEAGAKIVAVGDPNQGIYRFRGADGDAFKNLSGMLGELSGGDDWKEHTLTRNFRSRKCILDFVNERTHVKNLVQGKQFDDGDDKCRVTDEDYKYEDVFSMIKEERDHDEIKGTAFIARTNEPLVHASLKLLGNAVPFVIVGRDVAGDLLKHIEYLMKESEKKNKFSGGNLLSSDSPVSDLRDTVIDFAEKEEEQFGDKATKRHYLQELRDTSLAITSTISQFAPNVGEDRANTPWGPYRGGNEPTRQEQPKSVGEYMRWLEKNLGGYDVQEDEEDYREFKKRVEEENPVILTTAHKSKGLEFSRVFILRDDQFPHPKSKHPGDLAQEDNAQYVAYTRAMDELHIVMLKGQPGYKDS